MKRFDARKTLANRLMEGYCIMLIGTQEKHDCGGLLVPTHCIDAFLGGGSCRFAKCCLKCGFCTPMETCVIKHA